MLRTILAWLPFFGTRYAIVRFTGTSTCAGSTGGTLVVVVSTRVGWIVASGKGSTVVIVGGCVS
jgi:hypothetical protein